MNFLRNLPKAFHPLTFLPQRLFYSLKALNDKQNQRKYILLSGKTFSGRITSVLSTVSQSLQKKNVLIPRGNRNKKIKKLRSESVISRLDEFLRCPRTSLPSLHFYRFSKIFHSSMGSFPHRKFDFRFLVFFLTQRRCLENAI